MSYAYLAACRRSSIWKSGALALAFAATSMLGLAGRQASAASYLDQFYSYHTGVAGGATGYGFPLGGSLLQMDAESFTVGRTGQLTDVYMQVYWDSTGSISGEPPAPIAGDVTLYVKSSLGGSVLASGTVPGSTIPAGASYAGVDIFASQLFVTTGEVLYLVVASNNPNDNLFAAAAGTVDPTIAAKYLYSGGAAWIHNDTSNNWGQPSTYGYVDFGFETYVTPLPAALPLFASGAALIGLLGWCRNRASRRPVRPLVDKV